MKIVLGGGFKDLLFVPLRGEMIQFDGCAYFSTGWVQTNHQTVQHFRFGMKNIGGLWVFPVDRATISGQCCRTTSGTGAAAVVLGSLMLNLTVQECQIPIFPLGSFFYAHFKNNPSNSRGFRETS